MDVGTELLSSHRALTKANLAVVVTILFFCLYLAQRAFGTLASTPKFLLISDQEQFSYLGLKLTWGTLTYLWPLLLGSLCLASSALGEKQLLILSLLEKQTTLPSPKQLYLLDPFLIIPSHSHLSFLRFPWVVIAKAPLLTNGLHVLAVLAAAAIFLFSRFSRYEGVDRFQILFLLFGVMLTSVFGFWAALRYSKSMDKMFRSYKSLDVDANVNEN